MKWERLALVQGSGDDDYEIKRHPTSGTVGCTCRGWRFSKKDPRTCRHLRDWRHGIGILQVFEDDLDPDEIRGTPQHVAETDEETYEFLRSITL
jgi:hypothetical protein